MKTCEEKLITVVKEIINEAMGTDYQLSYYEIDKILQTMPSPLDVTKELINYLYEIRCEPDKLICIIEAERRKIKMQDSLNENKKLRKLLWISHLQAGHCVYGDDGELQCHTCHLDFKRDQIEILEQGKRSNWTCSFLKKGREE